MHTNMNTVHGPKSTSLVLEFWNEQQIDITAFLGKVVSNNVTILEYSFRWSPFLLQLRWHFISFTLQLCQLQPKRAEQKKYNKKHSPLWLRVQLRQEYPIQQDVNVLNSILCSYQTKLWSNAPKIKQSHIRWDSNQALNVNKIVEPKKRKSYNSLPLGFHQLAKTSCYRNCAKNTLWFSSIP